MLLSLAMNATAIGPNDPSVTVNNVIRDAVAAASANDVIELSDGIYKEDGNFAINKNITIQAAEGAHPVIAQKYYIYFNNSAKVTFKGIKFDGGAYGDTGAQDYALRTYGSPINRDETLTLEDCEFVNYPGYNIFIERADRGMDAITIRNCYFHNNTKYAIYIGKKDGDTHQSCNTLTIENSTFANVSGSYDVIYYDAPDEEHTTSLSVDHCTFYNHPKRAINWQKSTNLAVSNCVFAQPATNTYKSAECVGGTITNCLYSQSGGFSSAATRTNTIKGNPLFVDAANNDFRLNNASAARREDGSVWGDPRWATVTPAVAIPAKLNPVDAFVSDSVGVHLRANEADLDSIDFKMLGGSYGFEDMEWAKWKVSVSETGYYNFTAHVFRATSGSQKFEIKLLNSNETSELIGNTDNNVSGGEGTISTGKYELTPGEYVVKVRTLYNWAKSRVLYVDATYEGGKTITVPDTLWPVDALKSEYAFVNEDGELRFTDNDHTGYVPDQYGKWNIHLNKGGLYNFTLNAFSSNSHHYYLYILNTDESQIEKYTLDGSSGQVLNATTTNRELAAGDYIIKIENFTQYSYGRVRKIIANYEGGAVTAIPGQLLGEDALLHKSGSKYMIRTEEGYLKSSNNSAPTSEWAVWNITATAGTMAVTLNLDPVTSSGHNYRVELYDGETLVDYSEELTTAGLEDAVHSEGDVALEKTLVIPSDGSYTIKLINRTQWSSMILQGITFAPYVAPANVTMTDTDTDNTAWVANVGGAAVDVQMTRTILGGMYNTICLPFSLNSTKCKALFGNDVELYTLGSATLCGDILNLQFDVASDIHKGTPVLIKTSTNIVDPLFEGVTIERATADHTQRGIVDFRGTFVSMDFNSGDQVLLLLSNNNLAYPQSNKTLKGFRAYFQISGGAASAPVVRGARIIAGEQVVTAIDLVETQNETVQKVIENGQLIIIKDGVRYNVMGIQIQ